jgi:serine/threonine-protein kinase HipA
MIQVLNLLMGSDDPAADRTTFLKAQILFWLIGATDGHAKNFSIFLGRGGGYRLTPLYDVLTAQPSLDARRIERMQMKLAMSVGADRHYKIGDIHGRHFIQTGEAAGLPKSLVRDAIGEMAGTAGNAVALIESELPADFPEAIRSSDRDAMSARLRGLRVMQTGS